MMQIAVAGASAQTTGDQTKPGKSFSSEELETTIGASYWMTDFAVLKFELDETKVRGVVRYDDGREARIDGRIRNDQRLHVVWWIGQEEMGEVVLTMSDDGNALSGPYADLETGKVAAIALTRLIDVVGLWTAADLGLFEFTQDGKMVDGVLWYENGPVAWVNGRIVNNRLHFVWGIDQEELGEAALAMSRDGSSLLGPYADLTTGRVETFALTRSGDLD
jgi:hypothetical protein